MLFVGISGPQGAGKSFLADLIASKYSDVEHDFFSNPLYAITETLCGLKSGELDKSKSYIIGSMEKTGREWLQFIGTEVVRDIFGESTWVDLMKRKHQSSDKKIILLSGTRFENEYKMCDYLIFIESEEKYKQANRHRSEFQIEKFKNIANMNLLRKNNKYISIDKHGNILCEMSVEKIYEILLESCSIKKRNEKKR